MDQYQEKIKSHPQYTNAQLVADVDILYPPFALSVLKIFARACESGLRLCIYETYRSQERQLELFNRGVTKLKNNGMHHFGIAADIVFLKGNNQPSWDPQHEWAKMGDLGKNLSLFWGGDWEGFRDLPHFQLIEATVPEQAKIINGNYPPYDPQIDGYLESLLPFYNKMKSANYSEPSILDFLTAVKNIESPQVVEEVAEPKPVPMEVVNPGGEDTKQASKKFIDLIVAWCVDMIARFKKPK